MEVWGLTDTGNVRQQNQDAYRIEQLGDNALLAVVCDGMGGARSGNVASRLASEVFSEEVKRSFSAAQTPQECERVLRSAASLANIAVYEQSLLSEEYSGMGTTLVAALVHEKTALVVNIGDSRAYRISPEGICQITKDHSLVEDMVEHGDLTPDEARRHPNRNLITRALGPDAVAQTDGFKVPWKKGEFLLLCSDGLVNTVTDQEILFEMIHNDQLDSCLDRLMTVSKGRGAPDNVTAVLLMNI